MSWLRKTRLALFIVGVALCVGMLIGARTLTGGSASDDSKRINDKTPRTHSGPVVMGTVDTDPPPVAYGLPSVLQSGTIKHVFVKDGQEITAEMIRDNKHALYAFDDTIQQAELEQAKTAVAHARTKVKEAEELVKQHTENIKVADQAVEAAQRKVDLTRAYYKLVEDGLETNYRVERIPEEKWPERKKGDATLYKANVDYDTAVNELNLAKAKRDQLKVADPQVKVKEAEAAVKQADALQAKAQAAVDLCIIKAQMPGIVEQVTISPGVTLGISNRTALWLIPTGPRVVRGEVEADFAHRVGPDRIGREVTIYDNTDPKLTYTGTIRRISNMFLLKRANAENFLNGDTRVIEVVIEVTDPAPAGKPPLHIGQRVRVNLGQ